MTSAPAASTFRQQFQDRGRISEYDASVSRKDGQHGNRHGLLLRPSSRQRASRGRKHVGKVVDNNRLHGFVVGHKDSTEFSQGSSGGIKLINVLLAKLAQITSKALRISPKSQTS